MSGPERHVKPVGKFANVSSMFYFGQVEMGVLLDLNLSNNSALDSLHHVFLVADFGNFKGHSLVKASCREQHAVS